MVERPSRRYTPEGRGFRVSGTAAVGRLQDGLVADCYNQSSVPTFTSGNHLRTFLANSLTHRSPVPRPREEARHPSPVAPRSAKGYVPNASQLEPNRSLAPPNRRASGSVNAWATVEPRDRHGRRNPQTASKKRPAVVVSAEAYHQRRPDVIVMAVTSQIVRPAGAGWRAADQRLARGRAAEGVSDQTCSRHDRAAADLAEARSASRRRYSSASLSSATNPRLSLFRRVGRLASRAHSRHRPPQCSQWAVRRFRS